MGKQTDMRAVEIAPSEEGEVAEHRALTFDLEPFLDLLKLAGDPRAVGIATAVGENEHALALLLVTESAVPDRGKDGWRCEITQRSLLASQRGLSGRNIMPELLAWSFRRKRRPYVRIPKKRRMAGIICRPHGTRNDAVPEMKEQPSACTGMVNKCEPAPVSPPVTTHMRCRT